MFVFAWQAPDIGTARYKIYNNGILPNPVSAYQYFVMDRGIASVGRESREAVLFSLEPLIRVRFAQ
jgi:hypothetical protein